MPVRDPFSYSGRWDSVGLACAFCVYFRGPVKWPDTERVSHCALHQRVLAIELADSGYMEGEWFCKEFKDGDGRTLKQAQEEFNRIKDELDPLKLYGAYGKYGDLQEYCFSDFKLVDA